MPIALPSEFGSRWRGAARFGEARSDFTAERLCRPAGGRIIEEMVFRGGRTGWWRSLGLIGAALYVFFLTAAPFEHHDLVCHLKNPFHCTSCSASQLGSDPQALIAPSTHRLADAGRAVTTLLIADDTFLPVGSTGRSPPALV